MRTQKVVDLGRMGCILDHKCGLQAARIANERRKIDKEYDRFNNVTSYSTQYIDVPESDLSLKTYVAVVKDARQSYGRALLIFNRSDGELKEPFIKKRFQDADEELRRAILPPIMTYEWRYAKSHGLAFPVNGKSFDCGDGKYKQFHEETSLVNEYQEVMSFTLRMSLLRLLASAKNAEFKLGGRERSLSDENKEVVKALLAKVDGDVTNLLEAVDSE